MAEKVTLEAEIKSNIKKTSQETKELTNNFGAFGITIGGIKEKFKDMQKIVTNGLKQIKLQAQLAGVGFKQMFSGNIIKGAKTLFRAIATGVAATGIGALLVAFTSLAAFFTKTKKGAELLEKAFAGVGAAVGVVVDRVAKFGGAIVKLFEGDTEGALKDVKGAFVGIGDEIAEDTKRAIELKNAFQELRDSQRDLNVETAQQRTEIEKLKLIAEDTTKSTAVRLKAAQDAFDKENALLKRRIANAQKALRIQQEEMATRKIDGKNLAEDLDKEAELKIALANIEGESTTKQIELNNKINAIKQEQRTKDAEALAEMKDRDKELGLDTLVKLPQKQAETTVKLMTINNDALQKITKNNEKALTKNLKNVSTVTQEQINEQLSAYSGLAGALQSLAGESKELSIAQAIIDTYVGANKAFAQGGPAGFVTGTALIISGLANVKKIMEQDVGSGGGGGGASIGSATPATPAPEMMSGSFELSGGVKPEPVQAFVVSDDVTNNQDKLAAIRRRATI